MFSLMRQCCSWVKRREPDGKITLMLLRLDNSGRTGILGGKESLTSTEPTIGFSRDNIMTGKYDISIFDVEGGKNIRKVWKSYYANAFGIIFVVDCSDIRRMGEVKRLVEEVVSDPRVAGKPTLVLANKQSKQALREAKLMEYLSLNKVVNGNKWPVRIERCSAIIGESLILDKYVARSLSWLVDSVIINFDSLVERVEKDVSERTEAEEAEKREREEIIQKVHKKRENGECSGPGHSSNQEDNEEPNQSRKPFQPISKIINLIEEKIKMQKRKNRVNPTEDYLSSNEAEKKIKGRKAKQKSKNKVKPTEDYLSDIGAGKEQKLKKLKKRKNRVEPVEGNDEPGKPIPRIVHGRRITFKIMKPPTS
ncbi:ADP-ribosylation factor-like protein 13B [Rhinoraja longicauda]